ncbi:hypothetical protein M422DRAFT_273122 [Sphaerobolus stellatus SS14]|uniref:Polyketide synthase-like phosphopantetheine-binding domain-containing protein n=1 Tax=Sphaerobolus stellatus (strain SS14) TaxID=990650 RepID=A0A0C9TA12_SPHS4|nr:hypothetical protein M422DRAFT_273122 [Sphaerobolus stellatus SS14]
MSTQAKFTPVPLDKDITLDRVYEWHAENSTNVPAFTFPDEENKQQFITWGKLGAGIANGVDIIHSKIPETLMGDKATGEPIVVGVLSSAEPLSYTTFVLALLRLTHSGAGQRILPFLISTRNSPLAVAHLITAKKAKYLWVNSEQTQIKTLATEAMTHLEQGNTPSIISFPTFTDLYSPRDASLHYMNYGDNDLCGEVMAVHNSPIFHAMGILSTGWAAISGCIRAVSFPSGLKSFTDPERFLQEIQDSHATVIFSVPSFLEAWAADRKNVEVLKKMKVIYWGGGPLSERTGRFLHQEGVNIVTIYGATEFGAASEIDAKHHEEGYEWFRFPSNVSPALPSDTAGPDTFELIFKQCETHHLSAINMEIDGVPAYATSDIIQRHEIDHTLFRIMGRKDDQIMLSTGEKTNPGPIEHIIMKNPHVRTALMFGRGKLSNGVLIEPKSYDDVQRLGLEKFRNLIWPNIEEANDYAPAHSRIFKEMILVASSSKPFSYTVKNTARRGAILKDYADEIEEIYEAVDDSTQTSIPIPTTTTENGGWPLEDTREFVHNVVHEIMKDVNAMKDSDDLFSFGCDSLQATYIRNTLLHGLRQVAPISIVQKIPSNFVYQHPTVNDLAQLVANASQSNDGSSTQADPAAERLQHIQNVVQKYTQNWPVHKPAEPPIKGEGEVVLLTGSTGGLGSQILAQLVTLPSITRIYAFNRPSKKSSLERHIEAFTDRGNDLSLLDSGKIVYVEGDTAVEGFAIDPELFKEIQSSVTTIIHNAWRVDFNLSLASFEPAIRGVRYMVDLALGSPLPTPPRVMFTSSIGNIKSWSNLPPVAEEPVTDLSLINMAGYSESKWISEQILEAAHRNTALKPVIIRVGQLSGGLNGNWNAREWFPSLVRASQVVKGAPETQGLVSFVPLHVAASAIIELRNSSSTFAHLVHPRPMTWKSVIGNVAENLGVPTIPFNEWLKRLEAVPRTPEALHNNPALHLLDFYHACLSPTDVSSGPEKREAMGLADYETTQTVVNAPTLNPDNLPQLGREEIDRWMGYWERKGALETLN